MEPSRRGDDMLGHIPRKKKTPTPTDEILFQGGHEEPASVSRKEDLHENKNFPINGKDDTIMDTSIPRKRRKAKVESPPSARSQSMTRRGAAAAAAAAASTSGDSD
jgi:hypothetical protein